MKRQLTAEQIEKRDARRKAFGVLWSQVSKMGDTEKAVFVSKFGFVTCDGHQLSLCNQMLIALQCPQATVLGGFRQWLKHGRAVQKGQHGIMIWVPIGTAATTEHNKEIVPQAGTAQPEDSTGRRFVIGTIFDVSQTLEIESAVPQEMVAA